MSSAIPVPPSAFSLSPYAGKWFPWARIEKCFWPKSYGFKTSLDADKELGGIPGLGGVYLIAWSPGPPRTIHSERPQGGGRPHSRLDGPLRRGFQGSDEA